MDPHVVSSGHLHIHLQARLVLGSPSEGGPRLVVTFALPTPPLSTIYVDNGYPTFTFVPLFSPLREPLGWEMVATGMIHLLLGRHLRSRDLLFLHRAFCSYSFAALNRFNRLQGGGRAIFLVASILISSRAPVGTINHPFEQILNNVMQQALNVEQGGGGGFGGTPASTSAIQRLQTVIFGNDAEDSTRETSCVICLEDFEPGAVLDIMPCSHRFHANCLEEWLRRNHSCPLCRFPLPRHG